MDRPTSERHASLSIRAIRGLPACEMCGLDQRAPSGTPEAEFRLRPTTRNLIWSSRRGSTVGRTVCPGFFEFQVRISVSTKDFGKICRQRGGPEWRDQFVTGRPLKLSAP